MTALAVHPTPAFGTVMRAQLRAVLILLRPETWVAFGRFAAVWLLQFLAFAATDFAHPTQFSFSFSPADTNFAVIVAVLVPFGVWRAEDPLRRLYHWALPVPRVAHTFTKVFAGWVWLMGLLAALMLCDAVLTAISSTLIGLPWIDPAVSAVWPWVAPFAAATIIYWLTSAVVVGSNHPGWWIAGGVTAYLFAITAQVAMKAIVLAKASIMILYGRYGLLTALLGHQGGLIGHGSQISMNFTLGSNGPDVLDPSIFPLAYALWLALGVGAVVFAASRRGDN